jgi:hypothetical protein
MLSSTPDTYSNIFRLIPPTLTPSKQNGRNQRPSENKIIVPYNNSSHSIKFESFLFR